MPKYLSTTLFLVLLSSTLYSQSISYGAMIGRYFPQRSGINEIDSIRIVNEGDEAGGELIIGAYVQFPLSESLRLKVESSVFPEFIAFVVYNFEDNCTFCPVEKVTTISHTTIQITPQVDLKLFNFRKVTLRLTGGSAFNFQVKKENPQVSFNGKHEGVATVINTLDSSPKAIVPYLTYGLSAEYKVFNLEIRRIENLSASFTNNLNVYGKSYTFNNRSAYTFITLRVQISDWLKKKT